MNVQDDRQIKACEKDPNCDVPYHQPGSAAGLPPFRDSNIKSCAEMTARIRAENPNVTRVSFAGLCPNGKSKIALAVDPDEDYHFWRQDSNGWWSQKGGAKPVTNKDASDRPMWDPALCDNNWTNEHGKLDYDVFCAYMCVPRVEKLFLKTGGGRKTKKKRVSASRGKKSKWSRTFGTKRS